MKRGFIPRLVLGCGLAMGLPLAAQADAGGLGYTMAHGSFDPAPLCANAGHGCVVTRNQITLAEDVAIGKLHGAAVTSIRYTPYPQCEPWVLTMWMEFKGEGDTVSEAVGTIDSLADLDFRMPLEDTCVHKTMQMKDTGVWEAKPQGGDKLRGEIFFPKVEGVNAVDFTLDVTWQAEAPKGFFDAGEGDGTGAFFFYFDELMPGG